jgi:hypothetical protein
VLQPEPVFRLTDEDPQSLGTAPLTRVAYSRTGRRVVAFDIRGVYHVFRVRVSHGFSRDPEAWTKRLCKPEINLIGDHGRYIDVTFGDGEHRLYDQDQNREIRWFFGNLRGATS